MFLFTVSNEHKIFLASTLKNQTTQETDGWIPRGSRPKVYTKYSNMD